MLKVRVKVKFFSMLAVQIGVKEQEVEVSADLLSALCQIDESVDVSLLKEVNDGKLALLLNGKSVKLSEYELKLNNNDTLSFLPIMGGG